MRNFGTTFETYLIREWIHNYKRSVMITKQVFFDDNLSETENIFGKEWRTGEDRSRSFLNEFNKAKF